VEKEGGVGGQSKEEARIYKFPVFVVVQLKYTHTYTFSSSQTFIQDSAPRTTGSSRQDRSLDNN
jgi:hypothetical protein